MISRSGERRHVVTVEIEELQRQNRFRDPQWFLYLRAFLTLEGVSLQSDSNYSLIQLLPLCRQRLVVDQDPRLTKALRDLLYGRVQSMWAYHRLVDGFHTQLQQDHQQ
jgi:predicted unusual protein kinase regulating ubiquinone biosynthesis (AarF/ABC1/UbiB family)